MVWSLRWRGPDDGLPDDEGSWGVRAGT
jgi:hypothetical protein